jgi:predicted GNAT family N-acyltransferase
MHVRIADFNTDYDALRGVRFAVFVDEQAVPEDIEMDDRDVACVHVLAFDDDGAPAGTARIDLDEGGKIGRLAVLASHRRGGVGTALMIALHSVAKERGLETVWCNAQVSAVPFYESLGYRATSAAPFYEAGIAHVRMQARLRVLDSTAAK